MLKNYKNRIFSILKESGLDIDQFGYTYFDNKKIFKIDHKGSNYFFIIEIEQADYHRGSVRFSRFAPTESYTSVDNMGIVTLIDKYMPRWLSNIKEYLLDLDTIDEWELYKNGNQILNFSKENREDRFTESDLKNIEINLINFKTYIINTYNPDSEKLDYITEKINYLVESSKRNTIYDWQNIVLTVLLNIASSLLLDHEKANELFNYFKNLFITILFLSN